MTRALLTAAALLLLPLPASALCPEITRDEIIKHAKTGVGCKYVWGGTCWDPNNKSWKGADCSGYVTKCWQIPKASKYTDCLPHYYTTATFDTGTTHWTHISRSALQKGDALNYRASGKGHIVIYYSGDKWGAAQVYEARGTAYGIVHRTKTVSSSYKARQRHRLKSGTTPATYPLMTISAAVQTITSQQRDLCQRGKSKGIFDWWVGQETEVHVHLKNSGTAVAKNVKVKLWLGEPHVKAVKWNIYTDWKAGGKFILNDTDGMQKIPHSNPGKAFELWLSALSINETKRIKLRVKAARFSHGVADHPEVRAWISNVDGYYGKSDWGTKATNTKGYQKQNGGDLRASVLTDVLAKETCDGKDNDCDGKTDEDNVCGKGKPDGSGVGPSPDRSGATPAPDTGGGNKGKADAAAPPPEFTSAEGCSVSGGASAPFAGATCLLGVLLLMLARRRGQS